MLQDVRGAEDNDEKYEGSSLGFSRSMSANVW